MLYSQFQSFYPKITQSQFMLGGKCLWFYENYQDIQPQVNHPSVFTAWIAQAESC